MKPCERDIQRWLQADLHSAMRMMLPNYTPGNWFECDLFGVTRAGLFHEHEIKLTVADFRADVKKSQRTYEGYDEATRSCRFTETTKHARLANRDRTGPACFYYVVPKDMIAPADVPEWAGLKYVTPADDRHSLWGIVRIAKQAPRLHSAKVDERTIEHARSVCYFRYWNEIKTVARLRRDRQLESAR